ncbi:hypothetical protein CBR_g50980 [Chara braunii]|uniref:DUF659 domain-containing protein n=1 Tax=Chara braunii TaxID=69332 RepID=A0A388M7Z6_CHABU|nr:hypothetical protein CBR_g50980 [Chara braunii]|eukprot:GBG90635.1 hypothetical protein CBR_g50980 [Chara braunii]
MADEGIRNTRAPAGGQRQRMDDVERDDIQDAVDEEEGHEGGAREEAVAHEADEAVGKPNLPGEEVVMTSRGVGGAGPATRAPRAEVDRARREKRTVGQAGVEVPDTGREKRARQTTIDKMYAREKLVEFTNTWLQWIYVKKLPLNAFCGPEFQRVQQAAKRVPRFIQFRFPSYRVTAGAGIPSQREKVATMVSEVRATFWHSGATILSDGRKSCSGKPLVNFLAGGANGALLYATVARDGSVRDTADVVYRRWWAIILSFPAKDVIGFCTDSASNYTAAACRFATDPEPDIRRITWLPCSTHVCNLMLSDIGTRVVWVKETIILARALVRFIKSHGAAHALFRKVSPRVQLVEPVETRFASVFLILTCLKGRRDTLESMLHGDAWARIPWDRAHVSQAQWVQQQIRDGEFWQRVHYAILVMSPVHQLLRRMDRGGMMMSVIYEWSQHLLQLMRRVDVPTDMIEPCVREVAICNLHMLEPAHIAAYLLNPRRRSLTYYHSLQTTADDRLVVEECDRFLLAQTSGNPVGLLYRTVRDQMRVFHSRRGDWGDRDLSDVDAADCRGDSETERCAVWWFEHGRAHPELRTIAIRVMHFGRGGTAAEEEDEEGDVEPEVWGARPDGSVLEQEIQRQIVAFRDSRPSRARSVRDVFGNRATELRPWLEGGDDVDAAAADDDIDDDWTDDDNTPLSRDPTAERVYFTYGGGCDGTDSFTSVITGDVSSTAPASGSSGADVGRGGRSHTEVRVDDSGEQQPRGGLWQTGRRWEVRSDSEAEGEAEDEEVPLCDRRFSPSHYPISAQPEGEPLRRSERLASAAGRDWTHDDEDRGGERTPSDAGIRPRSSLVLRTQDFKDIGLGGSLGDFSVEGRRRASPQDVRTDMDVGRGLVETEEERDARLDREEEERLRSLPQWEGQFAYLDEQRRQRDLETGGEGSRDVDDSGVPEEAVQWEFDSEGQDVAAGIPEGQDVVMRGGSPSGGRGDSKTAGDEGQGAAVCGRGEGGPGGDGDTAGVGGDDGPDGDDDDDHGPEDDPYRLALVLRDPTVPPLRPDDTAHTFFDADALAHALTDDPFAHVSRKGGKQRAPGRVYSPPPFTVQSPHWSGSSLSGVRGRESGVGDVGSGRRSDDGRDSAGSMPPLPARTPEARVDTGDRTVAPEVAHSGGSPPPVRGGVGGGWSAVRRVGDRLWADYEAGRGVFTGRSPVQTQAAEGGSGRPSLQMAGRMLGLSRAETRRTLVLEAAGTSTDRLQGEQFTSGEEGLLMRPGTRRQHGLSEVEARLAAEVAAGQAALDAIQSERERGITAQAEEDEDTDTESKPIETAARRHRAQVAAAATAAHAAYVSGARGTGAGGRGGRRGGSHDRQSSGRGRAHSAIRQVHHPRLNPDLRRLAQFFCTQGVYAAAEFRFAGNPRAVLLAEAIGVHRRSAPGIIHVSKVVAFSGDISTISPLRHIAIKTTLRLWAQQLAAEWNNWLTPHGDNLSPTNGVDFDGIRTFQHEPAVVLPELWRRWREHFVELLVCLVGVRVTWTQHGDHRQWAEYLELLIIQAWRTEVEGDLLGFLFGSVRPNHRQPIVHELTVPLAQLVDDLPLEIVSQSDDSLVLHVLTRTLAPYLQWSACLEEPGSRRNPPSQRDYLDPHEIVDLAFFQDRTASKNEEVEIEAEEESAEDEEEVEEEADDEETPEEGRYSEHSEGEQSEAEEEEDQDDDEEEEDREELEESEYEGFEEEVRDEARAQAKAQKREEIAAGKRQLEFACAAGQPRTDDPARDPEPPKPEDGKTAAETSTASARRRRSRSPSPSASDRPPTRPRTDAGHRASSPVVIPPSP